MGLLDSVKERIQGERSFGRASSKADIGIDVERKGTVGREAKDDLFESREERHARNKATTDRYIQKVGRGIDRFNGGVDKVDKVAKSFTGGSGGRRKGSAGDDFGGFGSMFGESKGRSKSGSSGFDMGDLGFSSFGNMGGGSRSASRKKKASGGRRGGEVPIYSGSRIVGYRRAGGSRKKKARARSIFDI